MAGGFCYPAAAPFICGQGVVVEGVVVEGVVVELGAVVDEPDEVVAAPETTDPIPNANPNVPPATPRPSRTLLKGLFIPNLLWRSGVVASHMSDMSTSALH